MAKDLSKFDAVTVERIWERDQGRCVKCGQYLYGDRGYDWSIQHRKARGMGGAKWDSTRGSAANGILLCGNGTQGCHGFVEANPDVAREHGWSIYRSEAPEDVAVLHASHGWVFLEIDGTYIEAGERRERNWFPF